MVLRPAVERVRSPTSQFVLLMLASSIMSAVGAEELLAVANRIQSDTYRNFEVFVVLWGLYLALSLLMRAGFWLLARFIFRAGASSARRCRRRAMTFIPAEHAWYLLAGGAWGTIKLSFWTFLGGGAVGLLLALARVALRRAPRLLAAGYIQLIQGTPLLVLMGLCFFGPSLFGLGELSALAPRRWP